MSNSTDHHDDHAAAQFPHGTKREYVTGFILAVILTVIPFGVVMSGGAGSFRITAIIILVCAVAQMIVHMVYFLHMSPKAENGWSLISLVFTLILLIIAVSGTIWVMYNMDANMMPSMEDEMPAMQGDMPMGQMSDS
ncbi:cytochrome o ubiquinol oxidase subunit IV [Paracoccus aerodenitrificans]|uniref:cytochrome o ubiquinol oxidase subunit IV n=1 Tax=Paracoccus aerodenitrificans TaxID=3017781 RepID=UPI0022F0BF3B|nr:cytochrome o ubiquinol oxidase subunit IV [Paracoccus aerodenitrificans]WBU63994.1 cytochrome o ubiquinol oxidase subunit IV [Paracoccus aerodenitrificans]